jgi:hypothetical protein
MRRRRIVFGKDRERSDAEIARGARDADRDLAAIGDEQAVKRHRLRVPLATRGSSRARD